jgi:hypothetical protein
VGDFHGDGDVKETSEKQRLGNSDRTAGHVTIESSRSPLFYATRLTIFGME